MKKLSTQEVWSLPVYESLRDDLHRQMLAYQRVRSVDIGPWMTLLFEDRSTIKFQLQELLRAEGAISIEGVNAALKDLNSKIPEDGHLSATLMLSRPSADDQARLTLFAGLREGVSLVVGKEAIPATFTTTQDEQSTAHLDFALAQRARQSISNEVCKLRIRHPNYMYEATLSREMTESLRQDLYT